MTILEVEVTKAIAVLDLIAAAPAIRGFGDGYKQVGINFSIEACEIAAEITGHDRTFCKMLNHKFRADAARMMLTRAAA